MVPQAAASRWRDKDESLAAWRKSLGRKQQGGTIGRGVSGCGPHVRIGLSTKKAGEKGGSKILQSFSITATPEDAKKIPRKEYHLRGSRLLHRGIPMPGTGNSAEPDEDGRQTAAGSRLQVSQEDPNRAKMRGPGYDNEDFATRSMYSRSQSRRRAVTSVPDLYGSLLMDKPELSHVHVRQRLAARLHQIKYRPLSSRCLFH
ncbi:MAG: hypothetical protein ACPIOQ_71450 [Promethearchaeia archaeon]